MFLTIVILHSILITILAFSVYLIYNKKEHTKESKQIMLMISIFAAAITIDLVIIIISGDSKFSPATPLDYSYILTGITSQLLMHFFVYRMIFNARDTFKILRRLAYPAIAIIVGLFIADTFGAVDQFQSFSSLSEVRANIGSPVVIARLSLLFFEFLYSLNIIIIAHKLLPIYQRYIDKNESNSTHNILWIKQVCDIYMIITFIYFITATFHTEATFIIYLVAAIIQLSRIISLALTHRNIDGLDELYYRLDIKWSLKRMWYVDDQHIEDNVNTLAVFDEIDRWIKSERLYSNPEFSFKTIAKTYPNMSYNTFDYIIQQKKKCNFQSYIRECRIERAKDIIRQNGKNVQFKEIAYEIGFENLSAFSRAFKASTDMTPSKWRTDLLASSTYNTFIR